MLPGKFSKQSLSDKLKEFCSVILKYEGKEGFYRSIIRISHILIIPSVEKENLSLKQK